MSILRHSHQDFLKSAFSFDNRSIATEDVLDWIGEQTQRVHCVVEKIPFASLEGWQFDYERGVLRHSTGNFFSIEGTRVRTNSKYIAEWDQPIINQAEVGYLGFIVREINGVLHFLTQAKIEPGNINKVQLSPTLQATKSNYTRAHGGASPAYLEYFRDAQPSQVLVDQLQSEQGARFLRKRNRNIIIRVDEDVPMLENFIWLTLGQLKELMQHDNVVNMDTRTVVAGIPFRDYEDAGTGLPEATNGIEQSINRKFLRSALTASGALYGFDELLAFITRHKSENELAIERVRLDALEHWRIGESEIAHDEHKYFKVIATRVEIGNREVARWTQPMVESAQEGICAFVCKEIDGVLHFIVQAKLECGNFDVIELAPTVQCLTGNYNTPSSRENLPFLEYVLNVSPSSIVFDTMQSEEGGRFFREQNRNLMILAGDEIALELPANFIWMTLHQLHTFMKFNNYLNIQARSLLASVSFSGAEEN